MTTLPLLRHTITVVPGLLRDDGHYIWQARCSCGCPMEWRATQPDAFEDARTHRDTHGVTKPRTEAVS